MKRYMSVILVICLLIGAVLPTMAFKGVDEGGDIQQEEYSEIDEEDFFDPEDIDVAETESASEPEHVEEDHIEDDIDESEHTYENINESEYEEKSIDETQGSEKDAPEDIDAPNRGIDDIVDDSSLFLHITVENSRNVTVVGTEGIGFSVFDGDGEGNITIILKWDNPHFNIINIVLV